MDLFLLQGAVSYAGSTINSKNWKNELQNVPKRSKEIHRAEELTQE